MPPRRRLLGALLGAVAAGALPPARAQAPRPRPLEVAPGCWMVQGLPEAGSAANRNFISNALFIVTPDGVVLVDALGSPVLARELRAEIARVTPLPVTHVIVTHYHPDHVWGLQVFEDAGATIVAHRSAQAYLASDAAQRRLQVARDEMGAAIDRHTRLVGAGRWIDAPTVLTPGGMRIEIHPAGPAHTPEDLVVWLPGPRLLAAGDLVFRGRLPFVGDADSARWIDAIDRLLAFDPRLVVPGHGPLSRRPREDLRFTRDYLAYLRRTMGAAAQAMDPFDEAYARTDWSAYRTMPLFDATNRINAYNTYLLMERSAR